MEKKHSSQDCAQPTAVQQLNDLRVADPHARLRALLPLIDDLRRQGVSHSKILEVLSRAEVTLKPASLRQALHRWRRRQQQPSPPSKFATAGSASAVPGVPAASSPSQTPTSSIHSKADLVRLRNASDPIDLNELAEIGRRK
ncbi:hypothetical protein N5C72_24890 [Achromobacter mucicolens]|uniref:KfrA N-terminal DNA-binding domain-containing protein n=1 Tax=Achromobacter mucicolens TaxID=1389922 RepID=A0ABD4Z1W9_9BURK|nr:hypothetical protein [Achromobacter mucicolens]MDG9971463.1 hypothetical protein [Achromobacter mucicolens]MDH1181324.1 hypothetical protein [Achromobacter mucicolens]